VNLDQDYCELSVQEPEVFNQPEESAQKPQKEMMKAGESIGQSYLNPFERSVDFAKALSSETKLGKPIQIVGAVEAERAGLIRRKWRLDID